MAHVQLLDVEVLLREAQKVHLVDAVTPLETNQHHALAIVRAGGGVGLLRSRQTEL